MNRREFLASGGATLASAALGSVASVEAVQAAGDPSWSLSASKLCRAGFAQCVDSVFQLHHPSLGTLDLTLVDVREQTASPAGEQFTLLFRGPQGGALSHGTYVMAQGDSGYFPLYLDRAGDDPGGPLYRADFSLTPV